MTDMEPCLTPPSDFKPNIHNITTMWLNTWDESPLNKLHKITPIINEPCTHHVNNRRDQYVFNRCRIGHSHLTCEFLLKGEPLPECIPCNCPLTIKHLLIEGADFNDVRQRFYQVPSLQDHFKTVKPEVILVFLKAAVLYRLLCRAYARVIAWRPSVCLLTISFSCDTGTNRDGFESHSEYGYMMASIWIDFAEYHAE